MEENSEAHMDTDVSSTTEDILEVQEVTGSHRNVETVIVVEQIKEEDISPSKKKVDTTPQPQPTTSASSANVMTVQKSPQKFVQLKKIIINQQDIQVHKPVLKSPAKVDTVQKLTDKDIVVNKTVQSNPVTEHIVDSSSTSKNITKDTEKPVQKTPPKVYEAQAPVQSPVKVILPEVSEASKVEHQANVSLTKDQPANTESIKETPNKEANNPLKTIPKPPVNKEPLAKSTPSKEQPTKTFVPKEQPIKTSAKPQSDKSDAKETDVEKTDIENTISKEEVISRSNISAMEDKEASNDSQIETNSDTSEKDHNKSISRELRSLINSAKESKIISECTQLTSKTRKSRAPLDCSNMSLNASLEAEKIQGVRRGSDNSQKSNSSEKSEKTTVKRSMRSQNPEFVSKVKQFLNSVTGKTQKDEGDMSEDEVEEPKPKTDNELSSSQPKKKKVSEDPMPEKIGKLRTDPYCWRCHWAVEPAVNEKCHPPMQCTVCPRSYHYKCLTSNERNKISIEKNWVCPECTAILQAESSETRSTGMKKISLGMLCDLLKFALERMMDLNGVEPFMHPVDRSVFPDYDKYVVHAMDLTQMKSHIAEGLYGSTEAFLADAQWILHNSIIFNTCENLQSKLTAGARALVRSCRTEMGEIEACPECYAAAHARRPTWFTDVCSTPHVLLWAKLKGFPYWPAKAMSVSSTGLVDVRFFGAHDRAWVPARDCFLYSEKDPNNFRTKRQDIIDSMQEAAHHIRNISRKYGKFVYPPFKTQFDPSKLNEQLKMMIPAFEGEVRSPVKDKSSVSSPSMVKDKSRSNSKSSKSSFMDGDTSEGEDTAAIPSRKMADGAEIAREEEDFSVEKEHDKAREVEVPPAKEGETSRKRRRSDLEEAVITVLDTNKDKRKRFDADTRADNKPEETKLPDTKGTNSKEEQDKLKGKPAESPPKPKDSFIPNTANDKKPTPRITPIRVISIAKVVKTDKPNLNNNTKNVKDNAEKTTPKPKAKLDKSVTNDKDKQTPEDKKAQKRRNSRSNKSLNNSTSKTDKQAEKKNEKATEGAKEKNKNAVNKSDADKATNSPRSAKDRLQFDDDTSLAIIARESKTPGMPTISSVRSLSVTQNNNSSKSPEVTVEVNSDSSIFTPTSTENVRNMKEAVNKLQKLRKDTDPPVGRVGVRAFARMTSPPLKDSVANDVQVEIKTEPMDLDDADRQMEKMDLMNTFKLRPVNPPSNLREVRINKVVVTPVTCKVSKPAEARPRAKKTFPQPKKADDGRSELNSKNSMVYIPIQPPTSQAPTRNQRPATTNGPAPTAATSAPRPPAPVITTSANNIVNTVTTPLVPVSISSLTNPSSTTTVTPNTAPIVATPTIGQVPTTVHTVPLITSVNGQWTFSLQPVMSVGGVEGGTSSPVMNGLPERPAPALLPLPAPPAGPATPQPPNQAPSRTTTADNPHGEPPRLQQRPCLMNPLDPNTPMGNVPPPSSIGPLTAKLNQNAVKMTDFFRTLFEDCIEKVDDPAAQLTALKLQLEQARWRHQQELEEMKHTYDLTLVEMRSSFDKEKMRLLSETRRVAQTELETAVKHAKSKQWCANCSQEAQFYCCWNTSYCDYPCQRAHWAHHYSMCTQQRSQDGNPSNENNKNSPESRLQQAPDTLPRTTAAPNLTVGGKLAPSRVFTQDSANKSSIIVSTVDETSGGNSSVKCLGPFKQQGNTAQMSPLIINKQIMNNEEAAKKVVTSGGYLIVGAATAPTVPPNSTSLQTGRRAHTIYFS